MSEEIVTFGKTRTLVGILHRPEGAAMRTDLPAVVLLNAGILHRVGPNRVYVRMARQLQQFGFHVLRFDVWGIGDSQDHSGASESRTFFDDTQEAMDQLGRQIGATRFILMGICMGARIAVEVARRDPRVESAVLMEGLYVKSARYHISRMLDLRKWGRVLTGQNYKMKQLQKAVARRIAKVAGRHEPTVARGPRPVLLLGDEDTSNVQTKLRALLERGTKILLIFRDGNETVYNYRLRRDGDEISAVGLPEGLQVSFVRFADHTFTPLISQDLLLKLIVKWIEDKYLTKRPPLRIAA
jgi:pimeloyl-ACP methyl ester carboxylesterase